MNKKWKKLPQSSHDSENPNEVRYILTRPAMMARGFKSDNGIQIEAGYHYNGGGRTAFGGARSWPHVELDVRFQEGEEIKRDEFVAKLQKFVDENI